MLLLSRTRLFQSRATRRLPFHSAWPPTRVTGPSLCHQVCLIASASSSRAPAGSEQTHNKPDIDKRLPAGAWDSHMHILDPRFPLSKDAQYKPHWHTLEDWQLFEASVWLPNPVFVQPSIYGNDNSCLLEGLRILGPARSRGVVTFDPATTPPSVLYEWDALGVRGVRVNLKSVGKVMDQAELAKTLHSHAAAVRSLRWVIQIYLPMDMVPLLEPIVPDLGVAVCIDHMGHPPLADLSQYMSTDDPNTIPGFDALLHLLRAGRTYVKLSAPYRMSAVADGVTDVIPIARELLSAADERMVFATDWPHTRYTGFDVRPWIRACLDMCQGDRGLVEKLF